MKIEIRKTCKVCGNPITQKGYRTYCSRHCRDRFHNQKHKIENREWQRRARDKKASIPSPDKVQCLLCGKWYIQLGSHVVQRHGFESCREYRECFDLERKKGIVPAWYRKLKGDIAMENETYKNLKLGKKYWFEKGDPKAGKYKRSHITIERLKLHLKSVNKI